MKKVLFFLLDLFVSLTFVNGQSNVYHPFPDSNASWREGCTGTGPSIPPVAQCLELENTITGDTIIGIYNYKMVWQLGAHWSENCTRFDYSWYNYVGAIRQDIINKKVYFKPVNQTNDTLLYDFNLSVGDTLPASFTNNPYQYFKNFVTSIDSILIDGNYRKRFVISTFYAPNYASLIEGIGSTTGLLNDMVPMFEWGCNLFCLKSNGNVIFPDSNYECPTVSINENKMPGNHDIKIFPNPFTTSAQITLPQTYHHISLSLYDIQGKLMLQKEYEECNQIQLNRNGLNNGMYFLKLRLDERGVETGKIVVSE